MIDSTTDFIERKCSTKTRPLVTGLSSTASCHCQAEQREPRTGFTKVFHWPVPAEQTRPPTTVEVVGSFSGWHTVPLSYDPPSRTWQVILSDIEGNRTHRYVFLVDGKPCYDKACDGLTPPQSPDEAKWQIPTARGPRVMLLFSQTK